MEWLRSFVASGAAVDCVLVVVLIEALVLIGLRRRIGRSASATAIVSLLLPGACLLLALRAALTDAGALTIAAFLCAAFVAHLADLKRRLSRR